MKIKQLTFIQNAIDVLFEDNLRVWLPPYHQRPFFTQPRGWLIDPFWDKNPFIKRDLTDEEVEEIHELIKNYNQYVQILL